MKQTMILLCGASGVGKTTVKDLLSADPRMRHFACLDTDQLGLDWKDYEHTCRPEQFHDDCIARAATLAGERHLLFFACLNPCDLFTKVTLPPTIERTFCIALVCKEELQRKRLLARPPHWGCGEEDYLATQTAYNRWFHKNAGKFSLVIDNTDETPAQTADRIAAWIKKVL